MIAEMNPVSPITVPVRLTLNNAAIQFSYTSQSLFKISLFAKFALIKRGSFIVATLRQLSKPSLRALSSSSVLAKLWLAILFGDN